MRQIEYDIKDRPAQRPIGKQAKEPSRQAYKLSLEPGAATPIRFESMNNVLPFRNYHSTLFGLMEAAGVKDVCDVGGGANPEFSPEEVLELGLNYTVLDISATELARAGTGYETIVADIAAEHPPCEQAFDLVFTRMLAEHVRDGGRFHRNVFRMLRPGGIAFHFFPTLYALPFVLNKLMPETLAYRLLAAFSPKRDLKGRQGKFPAYYSWCRGPTPKQVARFRSVGFEVLDYVGIFGHNGYYRRVPPLLKLHERISDALLHRGMAWQTSYAYVVLRKPTGAQPS